MRPTALQAQRLGSLPGNFQESNFELVEALREIGKDLRSDLAFAPLRSENARDDEELPGCVIRQCLSRSTHPLPPAGETKGPVSILVQLALAAPDESRNLFIPPAFNRSLPPTKLDQPA